MGDIMSGERWVDGVVCNLVGSEYWLFELRGNFFERVGDLGFRRIG